MNLWYSKYIYWNIFEPFIHRIKSVQLKVFNYTIWTGEEQLWRGKLIYYATKMKYGLNLSIFENISWTCRSIIRIWFPLQNWFCHILETTDWDVRQKENQSSPSCSLRNSFALIWQHLKDKKSPEVIYFVGFLHS